ncbi:zinc metalloprotease HtpX [archaeon]|nr:zinc metalloprotease HtpX [archaeon]
MAAHINIFESVRANKIKSWLLFIFFLILVGALGALFGVFIGSVYLGLTIAVIIGIIYSLIAYYSGDSMILSMSGAKPVTKKEYPHLYHTVEGLAIAANIPTPKCYVIDDSALNAFATGRDPQHASITVTTGLMNVMNRQELEGVVAHEMSHIKNFDIRMMMLAAVLVGVVTLISDFMLRSFIFGGHRNSDDRRDAGQATLILIVIGIVLAILAPFIAQLIKLAISRKREFLADANGALLTRYPPGLAGALEKIKKDPDPLVDNANKATAHLFISTPFRKSKSFVASMFATHPDIDERISRLKAM